QTSENQVTILQTWGSGRSFSDTLRLKTDGSINLAPIQARIFPTNVFMGLSLKPGSMRKIKAHWENQGTVLKLETVLPIRGSQGETTMNTFETYQLSPDYQVLTYQIQRSTRKSAPAIQYLLKRAGAKMAWVMNLEDNWELQGKLPTQALLISLQGLANQGAPRLYLVYPETWDFRFTPHVLEFLKDKRYYTFTQLNSADQALNTFREYVRGYVVWDPAVRTSLMVAFTVAGLEKAVVVTEDLIPVVEKYGLKPVADFRGKFTGQSDVEIYTWAYQQYWPRCSKEYIVWMGGEGGTIMKPGVADWGIAQQAFFNDLSTRETDTAEYALAQKLLSEMLPFGFVFGWHSYQKDKEREHVKLTSSFALRVEGLHTLPNLSFSSQVAPSPGFVFKNNHHLTPGKKYSAGKKVYVACIQTDCLGLGAWTRPGRGQIPYAWEVTLNWVWLAPAMMEFFYTQATPNDYFIGALSGPGYMYPKAIPSQYLPQMIEKARALMQRLDLNVFEIMDYSEGATVEGNSELPREIVDAYYAGMPAAIGFVNGYAPAYTFTVKDQRPFISYDYYLSPTRPEADAVADLEELAAINSKRPYFLLVHVRQWSDISRVKVILDQLGPEFEVVPLDIFLKLAGQQPTFEERFLER
ncbi:hypothetical protein L0128_21200, partial [candidate division KSB1 bacterium]|nr:hypothetical protein [candidate division KSB1 bacterium]